MTVPKRNAVSQTAVEVVHRAIRRVLKFTWPAIHSAQLHANVVDKFDRFAACVYTHAYTIFLSTVHYLLILYWLCVCDIELALFHWLWCCCVWESLAVCERTYTRGHRNTQIFFCFIFSTDFLLFFAFHSVLRMKSQFIVHLMMESV